MATQRPGFQRADTDFATTSALDEEKNGAHVKAGSPDIHYMTEDSDGAFDATKEDHFGEAVVLENAKDILTHIIHVDDDPTLSPWTFRAFFLGKCPYHRPELF